MEATTNENPEKLAVSVDGDVEQNCDNSVSDSSNHIGAEFPQFTMEEVRVALETSASTGRFWQDWEKLKNILSYHLKQILSEYPEAMMTGEQQMSAIGETFQALVKRLDDALYSFDKDPPFTLQRLCEILLSARSIYPKLSKLALALEKNLFVTSTFTISSDHYPPAIKHNSNGAHEVFERTDPQINSVENGVEPSVGDVDEIMTDVEEAEANEDMKMDTESIEGVRLSEPNPSTNT